MLFWSFRILEWLLDNDHDINEKNIGNETGFILGNTVAQI